MLALRAKFRELGLFDAKNQPNFTELLDLVALGTVSDVVPLDQNNRILVYQGIARIRAERCRCGSRIGGGGEAGRDPFRGGGFRLFHWPAFKCGGTAG